MPLSTRFCGPGALSDRNLTRTISLWEARQAWCRARGMEYRILIVPERHALYPDKLPEGFAPNPCRPALRLIEAADAALRPAVVYPLRALQEGRQHHDVCYRSDVHWTRYGAYLAYRELMSTIAACADDITPEASLKQRQIRLVGDIALWLNRRDREVAEFFDPPPTGVREVMTNRTFRAGQVDVFETAASDLPRLALFRTSNSTHLLPFLFRHFSRIVAVASTAMHFDLLRSERPDVVISEISERYLAAPHEPRSGDRIKFPRDFEPESFSEFTGVALPLPGLRAS